MNRRSNENRAVSQERGIVIVTVALLLVILLGIGALAVDIGSVMVVRNELQNAADAGALAATRVLYLPDGTAVNPGANAVGLAAVTENLAQNTAVETNADTANNTGDIQRGHWRWSNHTFTPNDSLELVQLWGVSDAALDADTSFINAVRVRVRREETPAQSFLSSVIGFDNIPMQAEAVAYIGFAGSLQEAESDTPIAICEESLLDVDGNYSCSTGRMINSGGGETHNTGGWTNYTQDPCDTASAPTIRPYVPNDCDGLASPALDLGVGMGATGGEVQNVWDNFYDCWRVEADSNTDGYPDTYVNMTLPVVQCPGNNVSNCATLVGAVNVNMVWAIRQTDPNFDWVPLEMEGPGGTWSCPDSITEGLGREDLSDQQFLDCFAHFANSFYLVNYQETSIADMMDPLSQLNKTLYFLPDCTPHEPTGGTGGSNFSVLAKIPVLVQ